MSVMALTYLTFFVLLFCVECRQHYTPVVTDFKT